MRLRVVVYDAREGGFWGRVPAIPGCASQGETLGELLQNLYEATEACLSVDLEGGGESGEPGRVMEITV